MTLDQLRTDAKTRRAVERDIEIISEASRHLTVEDERNHPGIPWHKVRATGNVFRHQYESVDLDIVWSILTNDLAPLKAAVAAMIAEPEAAARAAGHRRSHGRPHRGAPTGAAVRPYHTGFVRLLLPSLALRPAPVLNRVMVSPPRCRRRDCYPRPR
jgi:uncharacterized protein with HEPN domain